MASVEIPTRRLGKSNLDVTMLGFGGIPIMAVSEEEAIALVRHAHDLGIRFFDSAHTYGPSEERIGKALEGREWVAATKTEERTAEAVYQDVKTALERMRRDFIELYQFHYLNTEEDLETVLAPDGGVEALKRAQAEGKIGHIGVTGHRPEVLAKAVERCDEFVSVQVPFNVVESESLDRLIPLCRERNVGVIAMKPVGGGNFSNAGLAVKWCLNQPITVAIPGMAATSEVEENVGVATADLALTREEAAECERMKSELDDRTCRRCGYCQPCPNGVKCNMLMILPTVIRRVGATNMGQRAYDLIDGIENCTECGACIERCPYDLPIPEIIRESAVVARTLLKEAGVEPA